MDELTRLRAYEQETIKALADAGLQGPPAACIAELHRDSIGARRAREGRDTALFELKRRGFPMLQPASATIAKPLHSFSVTLCERCGMDKNRPDDAGCSFASERANGACDQAF